VVRFLLLAALSSYHTTGSVAKLLLQTKIQTQIQIQIKIQIDTETKITVNETAALNLSITQCTGTAREAEVVVVVVVEEEEEEARRRESKKKEGRR
jgi:hypothetical protein